MHRTNETAIAKIVEIQHHGRGIKISLATISVSDNLPTGELKTIQRQNLGIRYPGSYWLDINLQILDKHRKLPRKRK